MVSTSFMVDTSSHPRTQLHRCVEKSAYQKIAGVSVWLPLALRLVYSDAALEGLIDTAQMSNEPALQGPDLVGNPIVAGVRPRSLGQR